jgi:hypothetical protein
MEIGNKKFYYVVLLLVSLGIAVQAASAADITGFKINDTNSNGILDSEEETIPGWTIILTGENEDKIQAETDSSGFYQFLQVSAGNYTLEEEMRDGWTNTSPGIRNIIVVEDEDQSVNFTNVLMVSDGVTLLVDGMESAAKMASINESAVYDLELTNNKDVGDTFDLQIENPDGANVTLSESNISLDPGESGNIELNVISNEAGDFVVNIIATSQNDDNISDTITTTTTFTDSIIIIPDLTLLVDGMKSAVKMIFPDEIAGYILELTNNGDAADTFDLQIDNPDNATVELSNSSIPLEPGDNATVLLNVSSGENGSFEVNVTATSQSDPNISDSITTITNVTTNTLQGIEITPSTAMLRTGENLTLTANETDVTWASSDPTVGTVDPDTGLFEAISPGTTVVTANKPESVGSAIINVGQLSYVTPSLRAGYNQIIVPLNVIDLDAYRLSQLVEAQTGVNATKIVMWDLDIQDFELFNAEIGMVNFDIVGGQAYFIKVDNDTTNGIMIVGDLIDAIEADQVTSRQFNAPLSGGEEVPPVNTSATGHASLSLNENNTELSYQIFVANITNVTAANIHMAPVGQNGSPVALLFTGPTDPETFNGLLAEGTITESDLTGPLEGMPFDDLVKAIVNGQTYINIHTEQNVDGEVRGQII